VFNYLENPGLTPVLKALIEESAAPLKAIETDFAVDSSGIATSVFARWFDKKYGREIKQHKWLKVHLMTGVRTNVVTAVEVLEADTADSLEFPGLIKKTAERFDVEEISADKAYLSHKNLDLVDELGAVPFIPFKRGTGGKGSAVWTKMYHLYHAHRDEFLGHYGKRSNVEATFSMIKRKFGGSVRSKTFTAQVNEILCKILCHNLSVLVQSQFQMGVPVEFWEGKAA
jgi:transposase